MRPRFRSRASRACLEPVAWVPPRRVASAGLLLALAVARWPCLAGGAGASRTAGVSEIVVAAEAALARGDAQRATELFESAAGQEHASDIEVGLVRSLMQAGEYRKALAFAAHTAGAHANETAGAALYAWLLAVGGQGAFAQRLLGEVALRLPADPLIHDLRQRLRPMSAGRDPLPRPPARFGPTGTGTPTSPVPHVPDVARVVSTGVLVNQGCQAIAPSAGLAGASRMWVRNGLGRTIEARLEQHMHGLGVALLTLNDPLSDPLDAAQGITIPERDPFPGTAAYVVEYASADTAVAPAWPWLRTGFLGPVDSATGARRLGIDLPPGPRGGPVFDTSGRLVGLALPQAGGPGHLDRLLTVSALRKDLGGKELQDAFGTGPARPNLPQMALDDIYERALKVTLQIIAEP